MRWVVLGVFVLMLSGCGSESAGPTDTPGGSKRDVDVHERGGHRPAEIVVELPGVEVAAAGSHWRTERLSQQIDGHLKALSELIILGASTDADFSFVDDGVLSSALRPSAIETIYEDGSLRIRRRQKDEQARGDDDDRADQGLASFQSSLRSVVPPIDDGRSRDVSQAHGKFKIVSVDLSGDRLSTDLIWQLSIPDKDVNYQQNARWHGQWRVDADALFLLELQLVDFQEVETNKRRRFLDCTADVTRRVSDFSKQFGPSIDYWLDRIEHRFGILPTSYQGISVADVNGDGLDDVFIAQPGGVTGGLPNRLLIQQPDGTVIDRSAESGLDWLIETHAALFVDLDNDGDQDVVVSTVMGLVFAANDGEGRFERRAVKITPDAPPMSLAAADYDGDQDLDIYVCCYAPRSSSPLMGRPIPFHDANNGGRNLMLRNDRDWRFRNVTRRVGLDSNNRRFSFAASWEDYDNDGDLDLYVANDYGRNNLFRNDHGEFTDVAAVLGVEDISAGMSVTWGDYNLDGWMDLYVSNMWSSAGHRISYQRQFQTGADSKTRAHFQRHARGNSLFANQVGQVSGGFHDASLIEGVTMARWAWASQFADINNDGHLDIVVTNGFITQEDTSDL